MIVAASGPIFKKGAAAEVLSKLVDSILSLVYPSETLDLSEWGGRFWNRSKPSRGIHVWRQQF